MIAEGLVIFACLKNVGCEETSNFYYSSHPELREMVEMNEKRIRSYTGPIVINIAGPVAFMALGKTATFKLNKNFNLQMSNQSGTIIFNKDF